MCFFNVLHTQHLSPKSTNLSKIQITTIITKLRPTKFVMLTIKVMFSFTYDANAKLYK